MYRCSGVCACQFFSFHIYHHARLIIFPGCACSPSAHLAASPPLRFCSGWAYLPSFPPHLAHVSTATIICAELLNLFFCPSVTLHVVFVAAFLFSSSLPFFAARLPAPSSASRLLFHFRPSGLHSSPLPPLDLALRRAFTFPVSVRNPSNLWRPVSPLWPTNRALYLSICRPHPRTSS